MTVFRIQKVTWAECREVFQRIAPDLFQAIEQISPGEDLYLYRAQYPYGSYIIDAKGEFSLPTDTINSLPVSHPDFPKDLYRDLYYNKIIPLALVAKGMTQLYKANLHSGAVETHSVYSAGVVLGARTAFPIGKVFMARQSWMMTSGVRSAFFIPSISNASQFNRLRRTFDLRCEKPQDALDHFKLFRELANHPLFPEPWHTELYFFPRAWYEHLINESSIYWGGLLKTFLMRTWLLSEYERDALVVNQMWTQFSLNIRNKFVDDYTLSMMRHIVEASIGQVPIYHVYQGDSVPGPFSSITQIFLEHYGLKDFAPIIAYLQPFHLEEHQEAYVSLRMLSRHWIGAVDYQNISIMQYTRLIRYALNLFLEKIKAGDLDLGQTYFRRLLDLNFDFFFSTPDPIEGELQLSSHLFDTHPQVQRLIRETGFSQIPTTTRDKFLNSCVKISKN